MADMESMDVSSDESAAAGTASMMSQSLIQSDVFWIVIAVTITCALVMISSSIRALYRRRFQHQMHNHLHMFAPRHRGLATVSAGINRPQTNRSKNMYPKPPPSYTDIVKDNFVISVDDSSVAPPKYTDLDKTPNKF